MTQDVESTYNMRDSADNARVMTRSTPEGAPGKVPEPAQLPGEEICTAGRSVRRPPASELCAHPGDDLQPDLVPRLFEQTDGLGVADALQRVSVHGQQPVATAQLP